MYFIVTALLVLTSGSTAYSADLKLGGKSCYDPDCNDDCVCTSFSPPGGLPRSQTPQFILVTHDDAVHNYSATNIEVTFGGLRHSNGCRVPCTFFAQASGSDADVIHSRWMLGDEFAAHAVDHVSMQHPSVGDKERRAEILGSRHWLINEANLPAEDVVGYRAPFYKGTPEQLQLIGENGFLYDASRIIMINEDEIGGRIWPYPLERGVALAKKKKRAPTYDGLWEVPAWQLAYDGQYYVSDAGREGIGRSRGERDTFKVLQYNFNASYEGNRAPVPLFFHQYFFDENRGPRVRDFVEYAITLPGVYFVTLRTLIEWMKDPVPVDRMDDWLGERCGTRFIPQQTIYWDDSGAGLLFSGRKVQDNSNIQTSVAIVAFSGWVLVSAILLRYIL